MDHADMERKIKEIISAVTRIEISEISSNDVFGEGLDIDSLSRIEVIVDIQSAFQLEEIPEEQINELRSVSAIADYLQRELLAQGK